jgi:hypothetical protein
MKPGYSVSRHSLFRIFPRLSTPLRLRRIHADQGVFLPPYQGGHIMKTSLVLLTILAVVLFTSVSASANPATLPKHPGYPMDKAISPVSGQSLANDPGQSNAIGDTALMEAAAFDDTHVMQSLSSNSNEQELRGKSGANASPKTQEPNMKKEQKEHR